MLILLGCQVDVGVGFRHVLTKESLHLYPVQVGGTFRDDSTVVKEIFRKGPEGSTILEKGCEGFVKVDMKRICWKVVLINN